MWGTMERDEWIKKNLPSSCSAEMKLALEVVMRQAYEQGYEHAKRDARRQKESDDRERLYGPDI